MDKVTDFITIRVPPYVKTDYDRLVVILSVAKKKAKMAILHAMARICFSELHYDPTLYFGHDYVVECDE